jgi:hypothetical protein
VSCRSRIKSRHTSSTPPAISRRRCLLFLFS